MNIEINTYGNLCSLCYDLRLAYAPQAEVDFFAACIDMHPGRVLEAMSGSGRLLIPLLQRGYIVDGVDCSPDMLARCHTRCEQLHLKPTIYKQALEHLSLSNQYTTILVAIGSFQLICDRMNALQALKNLHAHLVDDSNLFIDIFVPETTGDPSSTSTQNIDNNSQLRMTKKYIFEHDKQIAQALCTYELIMNGVVQQTEQEILQVVWYSDEQWAKLLAQAGFKIIKIYDEPYGKNSVSRVLHAKKSTVEFLAST